MSDDLWDDPQDERDEPDERAELDDEPRRWGWLVAAVLTPLVVIGLIAALLHVGGRATSGGQEPISVRVRAGEVDELVTIDADRPVSDALAEAGVAPHDGVLRSAVDGAVLEDAVDAARITVDGRAADDDAELAEGAVIEVVDGVDAVEATEVVPYDLPADPLPDVIRHVHERGVDGKAEKVVGVTSGEVVSEKTLSEPIQPVETDDRVVALTFDDGPNETWTPQILRILAEKGVKATFCQVGENVTRRPDLVQQVVDGGHQLCNHTLDHDEGMVDAPQEQLDLQIGGGRTAYTDQGLPDPPYFRPPGGFLSDAITATARANGEVQTTWKVDTEDWRTTANPLSILGAILEQVDDGAIILLHDGGGATRQATVDALGPAIDLLRSMGYGFSFPVVDPT